MEKLDEANELYKEVQYMKEQLEYSNHSKQKLDAIDHIIKASKLQPEMVAQMISEVNMNSTQHQFEEISSKDEKE